MTDEEKNKLAFGYAVDARKTEIALLWSRSLYFWGFITVTLGAYGTALKAEEATYAFLASCVGIILSLCWTLANRSGKYWQAVWEWTTEKYSEDLFENKLFTNYHQASISTESWWGPKRYSPSKLAMAVSDMSVVAWILLAAAAIIQETATIRILLDLGMGILTMVYAEYILRACRSGTPPTRAEFWSDIKRKYSTRKNLADF